jgi:hypothetical protein
MLDRGHVPGSFTTGHDGSWNYPDGDGRTGPFRGGRRAGLRVLLACVVLFGAAGGAAALAGRVADEEPASCPVREPESAEPAVDTRPLIPPSTQPAWLGLPDTEPPDLSTYPPSFEWTYGENFGSTVRFVEGDRALGWPIGVSVGRGELDAVPGHWTSTVVQGHPAVEGGGPGGSPTVLVDLGDGWRAGVGSTGDDPRYGSEGFEEALALVRETADSVVPLGADHWMPIVDRMLRDLGGVEDVCYRLGLGPEDGRTFVTGLSPPQVLRMLTVPGFPTNSFELVSTPAQGGSEPSGEPVRLGGRAIDGARSVITEVGGRRRQVLTWIEDGYEFRLLFPLETDVNQAVSVADRLVVLDEQAWSDAVFPTAVPADLDVAHEWAWPPLGEGSTASGG